MANQRESIRRNGEMVAKAHREEKSEAKSMALKAALAAIEEMK
jgi:hypothetical protein